MSERTSYVWKKIIFGILLHVVAKNGKHVGSIINDSVIPCDKVIETTKTVPTKTIF